MRKSELESIAHRHAVSDCRTYIKNTQAHAHRGQLLQHIKELYDAQNSSNTFDPFPCLSLRDRYALPMHQPECGNLRPAKKDGPIRG